MNKINTITRITSETLDKYRNSIPRKAFTRAMERIAEEVITIGERQTAGPIPGIEILKRPDITAGEMADLISGCCPPYADGVALVHCDVVSCRACWLAWLTTGKSPTYKEGGDGRE